MRLVAVLLLLANALFFGWTQGWLDGVAGVRARGDREPERLALQVRPEAIRVLTPQAAAALAASAATAAAAASDAASAVAAPASGGSATTAPAARVAPTAAASAASANAAATLACLEAGPFSATEVAAAEAALKAALPAGRWTNQTTALGGAWIIYMGKYPNRDAQLKKEDELRRIKITFEELAVPPNLGPGLSLGRFDNKPAADAALAQLARRGIRTARVQELTPPVVSHLLRVDRADAALATKLAALQAPALGRGFSACRAG